MSAREFKTYAIHIRNDVEAKDARSPNGSIISSYFNPVPSIDAFRYLEDNWTLDGARHKQKAT